MSERRPSRGSGPRSTRGPAPRGGARPRSGSLGATRRPQPAGPATTATAAGRTAPKPRLTGRAAILILVVAVLAVSYASSMRAYLQQQEHTNDLQSQIARTEQQIDALEREKKRWADEAYIEAQARLRLGYVMPGETTYVVLDEDGKALDSQHDLPDPDSVPPAVPDAWWDTAWESLELAGNPELAQEEAPAQMIEEEESE